MVNNLWGYVSTQYTNVTDTCRETDRQTDTARRHRPRSQRQWRGKNLCQHCCWGRSRHDTRAEVVGPVCVCLCVCVCAGLLQCNHPIPLKLAITNGPGYTSRKNWLTFDGDAVPDTDSGSLFHFHHHCGIRHLEDLLAFLILTSRSSWNSATWLTPTRE